MKGSINKISNRRVLFWYVEKAANLKNTLLSFEHAKTVDEKTDALAEFLKESVRPRAQYRGCDKHGLTASFSGFLSGINNTENHEENKSLLRALQEILDEHSNEISKDKEKYSYNIDSVLKQLDRLTANESTGIYNCSNKH